MTGVLARIGIALGLLAGWILPVSAGPAAPRPQAVLRVTLPPGPNAEAPQLEAAPAPGESRHLRPVQGPQIPGRQAPSFHRGPADPIPGAPPGGTPHAVAPTTSPVPRVPGAARARAWTDQPRTFSPQGLKPEQGGQTGPPGTRVSA